MKVYVVQLWSGTQFHLQAVYTSKKRMVKDWSGKVAGWSYVTLETR